MVEPDPSTHEAVTLRLQRQGNDYDEVAMAIQGETLQYDQPFPLAIPTAGLP